MVLVHLTTNFVHHPGIMHCVLNTNPDVLFEKEKTYFYKINLINTHPTERERGWVGENPGNEVAGVKCY